MFLLMGKSGEYEQSNEMVLGLFDMRDQAERAVREFAKIAEREWAALEAFRANMKARAAENGYPAAEGYILDDDFDMDKWRAHNAEVSRLIEEAGGEPQWRYFPECYAIVEIPVVGEFVNCRPDYELERPTV